MKVNHSFRNRGNKTFETCHLKQCLNIYVVENHFTENKMKILEVYYFELKRSTFSLKQIEKIKNS